MKKRKMWLGVAGVVCVGWLWSGDAMVWASQTPPSSSSKSSFVARMNLLGDMAKQDYVPHELVVQVRAGVAETEVRQIAAEVGARVGDHLPVGDFYVFDFSSDSQLLSAQSRLLQTPQVVSVSLNHTLHSEWTPHDTYYSKQWYLRKIEAPKAWDITRGSSSVTVAVVDDGVDVSNSEFRGRIVNPYDVVDDMPDYIPGDHATHVAGIIAASMNGHGTVGVAPNVRILPVNVFVGEEADDMDVARGIVYAVNEGADIINLSLGGPTASEVLSYAVNYAEEHGVLVVAAAGNDHTSAAEYPAALPGVIGVSATNESDKLTSFSNYGSYVDLAAPGQDILSTVVGGFAWADGTSMAAPVVTGTAALVLSKNPFLSPNQVFSILKKSAIDLGARRWDKYYGYGRVDAYRALRDTPSPVSDISASTGYVMKGTNRLSLSFHTTGYSMVSVYVEDSHHHVVRRLLSNKLCSGGTIRTSWDGLTDQHKRVGSGTYTLIAKLTNGHQTMYKHKTVKVTDDTPPVLTLGKSSLDFSPSVQHTVQIPFHLDKSARVTAKLYASNGKYLETIADKNFSAGNQHLTWNGAGPRGKRLMDGSYRLHLDSQAANKRHGAERSMTITLDTRVDASAKATTQRFRATGKNQVTSVVTVGETVSATAGVLDAHGHLIKTLWTHHTLRKGTAQLAWNGSTNSGHLAPEGAYQFTITFQDVAGNQKTLTTSRFTLEDWRPPVVTAPADIKVNTSTKFPLSVTYSLNKPGQVSVAIQQGSQTVAEPVTNQNESAGSHTFTWNLQSNSGQHLPDGDYTYRVVLRDHHAQQTVAKGTIHVDRAKVNIVAPDVAQLDASGTMFGDNVYAKVYYRLDKPAQTTIQVLDESGQVVRTIASSQRQSAGIHFFTWDGNDNDGFICDVWSGTFTYRIRTVSEAGNVSQIQGTLSANPHPGWLNSQSVQLIPDDAYPWEHDALNLTVDLNHPIQVALSAYDLSGQEVVAPKPQTVQAGISTITLQKPANRISDDLCYWIVYTDGLGNKWQWYMYEWGSLTPVGQ
ncbi:MAG: S8 family serine peptidase [Alicyclobacillus herbarius]|uniref:S8 family serine peptidase n=1 Tax=Alicyclobacillus herbarius TaxID=122960 RepID=UPI0023563CD4|nr:S8 family serine peptidase [Alicyclobacillus herbarius]MCL6631894.1 S8 family serine peptidase [Alicyclobacillus herbarius]